MSVTTEFLREMGSDLSEREFVDLMRTAVTETHADVHARQAPDTAVHLTVRDDVVLSPGAEVSAVRAVTDWGRIVATSRTTAQVAQMLGWEASRVRRMIALGGLYAKSIGRSQLLPAWQFEEQEPLPGLREVLAALPADQPPLEVEAWMTTPVTGLAVDGEALSPRLWLISGGDPGEVVALTRPRSAWAAAPSPLSRFPVGLHSVQP
ncbi:hypothetical protein [Pengzhenrongella phosphoraccumulans]|uniref:hypothetical protein n=1 Tax=Pengzhenrongella phosphoraccumulans TaxID=3114394 RepID=UPI00388FE410